MYCVNCTYRLYDRVLKNGVDNLLAGYQPAALAEVVSRPTHLRHGGEAELVEIVQDLMVELGRDSPQAGNVQPLVTAGQLDQSEGCCEG